MNSNTTVNPNPFTMHGLPITTPGLATVSLGLVQDEILRDQLTLIPHRPEAVAAELRMLVSFEAVSAPQNLFVDLVDRVTCSECDDGLFEQVMDCQYEALLDASAIIGDLHPTLTTGSLVRLAVAMGGPLATLEYLMRRLMEGLPTVPSGNREDLLIAMSGLAGAAWVLVDALHELLEQDDRTNQASA